MLVSAVIKADTLEAAIGFRVPVTIRSFIVDNTKIGPIEGIGFGWGTGIKGELEMQELTNVLQGIIPVRRVELDLILGVESHSVDAGSKVMTAAFTTLRLGLQGKISFTDAMYFTQGIYLVHTVDGSVSLNGAERSGLDNLTDLVVKEALSGSILISGAIGIELPVTNWLAVPLELSASYGYPKYGRIVEFGVCVGMDVRIPLQFD